MDRSGKRLLTALISALLAFLIAGTGLYADVIWEPYGDDFYKKHRDVIRFADNLYQVREGAGPAKCYKSPEDPEVVCTLEEGDRVTVIYLYTDANRDEWGCFIPEAPLLKDSDSAWIPMSCLFRQMDFSLFNETYASEITDQAPGITPDLSAGDKFRLYSYPGSPDSFEMSVISEPPEANRFYRDKAGHIWGSIGYYYGSRDAWFCLDAPDASPGELYPEGSGDIVPEVTSPTAGAIGDTEPPVPSRKLPIGLILGLSGGAAALAAVLLLLLFRARRRKGKGSLGR